MRVDSLPAGLATIAASMDDSPEVRGAIAFCRAAADKREAETRATAIPDRMIAEHAALAISAAYRSRDTRAVIYRADGRVEVVR